MIARRLVSVGLSALAVLLALLAPPAARTAHAQYRLVFRASIPGETHWDYLTLDAVARRLYVTHGDRVEVLDPSTMEKLGEVAPTPGVHGVTTVLEDGHGFATNGADSSVTMFDLNTYRPITRLRAGDNPDALVYDPASRRLFVMNGGSRDISVFETKEGAPAGTIPLGAKPEFAVVDGAGRLFVNLEDSSAVAVVDTKKLTVLARWKLSPGAEPTGLALDPEDNLLFAGCRNEKLVILDARDGTVKSVLPIGRGVDGVAWDPGWARVLSSNGEGTITVVDRQADGSFRVTETVKTQVGARTLAVDPKTHRVFVATADYPKVAGSETPSTRPVPIRSSFRVLAYESPAPTRPNSNAR